MTRRHSFFNNFNAAAFALTCGICAEVEARAADSTSNAPPGRASSAAETNATLRLPEVVVEGRGDSLLGLADSATQGTVGAAQLADRPIFRAGEVLETVPGVI